MLLARRFAVAATASLLIAGGFLLCSAVDSRPKRRPAAARMRPNSRYCPRRSRRGRARRCASWSSPKSRSRATLSLIAPDGSVAATSPDRHGGPPYSWFAEVAAPAAGTWHATLTLDRAGGCGPITRDIVVSAHKPAPPHAGGQHLAGAQQLEQHDRERCFRHGSRSCSTRRPTRICRGRCGMRCCATDRAISCSTIWVAAKTTWRSAFAPTAPTSSTSCAPISPSRWGCRSAIRIARAASAASRRNATSGSTSSIPRSRVRRRRPNRTPHRPRPPPPRHPRRRRRCSGCSAATAASRAAGDSAGQAAAAEAEAPDQRSANICATSATSSIPAPCASRRTTTTPISTPCR